MNSVASQIDPELHTIRDAVAKLHSGPMKVFVAEYQPDIVMIISTREELNERLRGLVGPVLVEAQRNGRLSSHQEQKKESEN